VREAIEEILLIAPKAPDTKEKREWLDSKPAGRELI
jgi:hypothetical protein